MNSERLKASSQSKPTPAVRGSPVKAPKSRLGYVNLGLPSKYNYAADMGWPSQSGPDPQEVGIQSVEAEFQMYSVGALTKMDLNLPKFWEVTAVAHLYFIANQPYILPRVIVKSSPPFLGWL
jgi:hypothetical protein